jgi:hypothetical protein
VALHGFSRSSLRRESIGQRSDQPDEEQPQEAKHALFPRPNTADPYHADLFS